MGDRDRPPSYSDATVIGLLMDMRTEMREDIKTMRDENREGFRTVHQKCDKLTEDFAEHARDDKRTFASLHQAITAARDKNSGIRERLAKVETNVQRDAEARVSGTGRYPEHQISVQTPMQPIAINFNERSESRAKHSTIPPVIGKFLKSGVAKIGGAVGIFIGGALVRHFAGPALETTKTVTVQVPAATESAAPDVVAVPVFDAGVPVKRTH